MDADKGGFETRSYGLFQKLPHRSMFMKAVLALADGRIFEGKSFGATGEATGEVVFNTAMTATRRSDRSSYRAVWSP